VLSHKKQGSQKILKRKTDLSYFSLDHQKESNLFSKKIKRAIGAI